MEHLRNSNIFDATYSKLFEALIFFDTTTLSKESLPQFTATIIIPKLGTEIFIPVLRIGKGT